MSETLKVDSSQHVGVPDIVDLELSDDDWAGIERLTTSLMKSGATLSVARGFTDAEMENVYSIAYNFSQQEKFQEAKVLFRFLAFYGHMEPTYWMGLAVSQQALGEYEQAIKAYAMVYILELDNPVPLFHTAQCHIKNKNYESAQAALDSLILLAKGKEAQFKNLIDLGEILSQEIARKIQKTQQAPTEI